MKNTKNSFNNRFLFFLRFIFIVIFFHSPKIVFSFPVIEEILVHNASAKTISPSDMSLNETEKTFLSSETEANSYDEPRVLKESTLQPIESLSPFSSEDIGKELIEKETSYSPLVEPNPFQRLDALKDPMKRLGDELTIPDELFKRTEFWFNIYTLYDSNVHVIHHLRYPWIIFKIIDTREMIASGRGPLWLRRDRAQKYVANQKKMIVQRLRQLSRMKSFSRINESDKELLKALSVLPGKQSSVFRFAAENVRSQLGQMDFFLSGLKYSQRYLPYMEEIFVKQGLPIELTRLPFVESSFNIKAQSKVGASGIWQIMPRTGKAYLRVDKNIDERNSPLKATVAAARILRSYFHALKNWPLTVTGYNHGIGGVLKAKRIVKSDDLSMIIKNYHGGSFKFASSNFFTCFLAVLYAEKYHDKIFPNISKDSLLEREIIKINSPVHLNKVIALVGIDPEKLLELNLDIKTSVNKNPVLPKGFELHLPNGIEEPIKRKIGQEIWPTSNSKQKYNKQT